MRTFKTLEDGSLVEVDEAGNKVIKVPMALMDAAEGRIVLATSDDDAAARHEAKTATLAKIREDAYQKYKQRIGTNNTQVRTDGPTKSQALSNYAKRQENAWRGGKP